jgi:hypothetical protein
MAITHSANAQKRQPVLYLAHQRKQDRAEQSLEEHLFGVAEAAKSFAAKIRLAEQGEMRNEHEERDSYARDGSVATRQH